MKNTKRIWRSVAALALSGLYALAVQDLMEWLGPGRFMAVSAGVLAVMWLLADTSPHTVRYIAPAPQPVEPAERMTAGEALWIAALGVVLTAVCAAVLPALIW